MKRTLIGDLRKAIGQQVKIQGWMQVLRDQKKMQFLVIRDRTGLVQVVVEKTQNLQVAELISGLGPESAVEIKGKVVDNPSVKLGGLEIVLENLAIDNRAETPLPYDLTSETLPAQDYRLDWRSFDLRRPFNLLLFQVQTTVEMAMREYWVNHGFIEMHSPKLMGSPSESGAELFSLDYFDRKAYLAQSPQFYKQMAMAGGFERVFEIGPVFRADPSFTSRHMTEFTSVDMEFSWIDSHEDVMSFQEHWLEYIYQRVKDLHGEEIKTLFGVDLAVPQVPFPRVTMAEAYQILKNLDYKLPPERKGDLDPGGERLLGKYIKEKYDHDFVFITDWPVRVRPFYHMRYADRPEITRSYDLIGCGIEIATGAQREHRPEILAKQALEKGLHLELIQFYIDFFKYGCPSHGGFGFGLSRFLMIMLNIENIRETVYIFRGPTRLNP
jgi:nondiscriminating aspartyl-tRNA synthetase